MKYWIVYFCSVSCVIGLPSAENRTNMITTNTDDDYCREINCLGKEKLCLNKKCYCVQGYIPDDMLYNCYKCSEKEGIDTGTAATQLCLRRTIPLRIIRMIYMAAPSDDISGEAYAIDTGDANVTSRQDDDVSVNNNIGQSEDTENTLRSDYKMICEADITRQFGCPRCGRQYRWRWTLRHEKEHLTHKCPYCSYSYNGEHSQLETTEGNQQTTNRVR